MSSIAVLGAGAWGTALALLAANNGHTVALWDIDTSHIQQLASDRANQKHIPNVSLPSTLSLFTELSDALKSSNDILIAVPSHAFASLLEKMKPFFKPEARILWATKGIDPKSTNFLHDVAVNILGNKTPLAMLSGPSFAKEVAQGQPTCVTVASNDKVFSEAIIDYFCNDHFSIELTDDFIGIQLAGALKNCLAILVGISDGLGYGANTRAALMTKGIQQMQALGLAMGADAQTFLSFAGIGDTILTCTDNQSRNRQFGLALSEGNDAETAEKMVGTVEGKITTKNIYQLLKNKHLECPFVEHLYVVLFEGKPPENCLVTLLQSCHE